MITRTKIQKEITESRVYCDDCGKEILIGLAYGKAACKYCKKDLCENCVGHEEDTSSDYRTVFCKYCWEIGKEYRDTIIQLEIAIDELYTKWKNKCRDNNKITPPDVTTIYQKII